MCGGALFRNKQTNIQLDKYAQKTGWMAAGLSDETQDRLRLVTQYAGEKDKSQPAIIWNGRLGGRGRLKRITVTQRCNWYQHKNEVDA